MSDLRSKEIYEYFIHQVSNEEVSSFENDDKNDIWHIVPVSYILPFIIKHVILY